MMVWEHEAQRRLKMLKFKITFITASLLLCAALTTAAPAPDVTEQQQRARRQETEQQNRVEAPSVMTGAEKTEGADNLRELPAEKDRMQVDTFVIDDGGKGFQWLKRELKPYEHQQIGPKGLSLLAEKLNTRLKQRGFITSRVILPEQNIAGKYVVFQVLPGYIEEIKFADNEKYGTWRNAFPCSPGDILNVYDLDQGLEQMKQVPYQNVKMNLEPGTAPGKSIVVLEVTRAKPWSFGISWDDSGLSATGKHQGAVHFSVYNPTGLNEVLSVSGAHDTERRDTFGTKNYSFYYSIPWRKYSFSVSHYYSEYEQEVPALLPYTQQSKNSSWEFGVQRLLYRDRESRTQFIGKILHRHKRNYLNHEEIKVQELQTTAYQIGVNHRHYIGTGMIDALVYYQKGIPILGAMPGLDDHNPAYMTTRYEMWGWNLYYGTPFRCFGAEARYKFVMRGQYTPNMLYSADHFSIGGRYTVKGFSGANTLAAENGYVIKNEVGFPLRKSHIEPYIGVDYGRTWGASDAFNLGKALAGAYLGIRGKISGLSFDAFIGTPIDKPKGFKADKTACGFSLYWEF